MKKLLISIGAVLALLGIIGVGLVAYVLTFDPNANKDWIAARFLESTGRELTLGGEIDLSWYPWLGLTLNDVTISNGPDFSAMPLLEAEHAQFRIRLLPLLSGEYEIDTLRLHGARVNLEVLGDGRRNWELAAEDAPSEAAAEEEDAASLQRLIIGGVDIRDARLAYTDQQANTYYEMSNLNMTVGELVYGAPLDIALSLDAASRAPELATALALTGTVTYDVNDGRYTIDPLMLDATLRGPDVPAGSADISLRSALLLDMEADTLTLPDLEISALGTRLSADVAARAISTETPALVATLDLQGEDLAVLFRVFEQDELAQRISTLNSSVGSSFGANASIDADLRSGALEIPELSVALLGSTLAGSVSGTRINTDTPQLSGQLNAQGPDLPLLMEVVGQIQGGSESALPNAGRQLRAGVSDRAFTLSTDFSADLQAGDIQLPTLAAELLGFTLSGRLDARNMQDSDGSVNGALTLRGENLREVLAALDQRDLAEVAQSVNLDIGVSGTSSALRISPLNLELTLAGPRIPNPPQTLTLAGNPLVNLTGDSMQIEAFTLTGLGLNLSGNVSATSISNNPAFNGSLAVPAFDARALLQQLNQAVPDTADATALSNIAFATAFTGTGTSLSLNNLALTLDDSRITGDVAVSDLATLATRFTVNVDRIDADRYLAPPTETAEAEASADTPLPVDDLRQLSLQGALAVGELTISGLQLRDLAIQLNAVDGNIALNPIQANLYDGSFAGNIRLSVAGAQPTATVNSTLSAINLEPLLRDFTDSSSAYLTGVASIELGLSGSGADTAAIKRNLNGGGSLAVDEGVLSGVDVGEVLRRIETLIRTRQLVDLPQGGSTPFDAFSATLAVQNGVVRSDNLLISAPGWRVNGNGTLVDLGNDSIDFDLLASVEASTATRADEEFDLGGYSLPIACTGTLASPRCLPDAQQIITAAVGNAVQRRLGDFLQDRLGGGQQAPPDDPAAPLSDDVPEDTPEEDAPAEQTPADPAGELINRALERLLR